MGCPSFVIIGENLKFSICCHDPDTGVLTDADGAPSYRVYEDETATAILTGSLATLDTGNTTGFYSEVIACTAGNGFENRKTYTIYVEATVDSDTGGISYEFTAYDDLNNVSTADINAQILDVLNIDTFVEPGDEAPAATTTLVNKIGYLYKFLRNKVESTSTKIHVYNDAGTNKDHTSTISDDDTTFTRNEFGAGDP